MMLSICSKFQFLESLEYVGKPGTLRNTLAHCRQSHILILARKTFWEDHMRLDP